MDVSVPGTAGGNSAVFVLKVPQSGQWNGLLDSGRCLVTDCFFLALRNNGSSLSFEYVRWDLGKPSETHSFSTTQGFGSTGYVVLQIPLPLWNQPANAVNGGLNRVAVNGVEVPIVGGSDAAWTWGYPFPPSKWDPTNYRLWGHGSGSPDARVMYSGIASGTALITPTQAAALLSAALGVPPDPGTVGSVSFHSDLSWSAFSASPFPPSSATSVGMALGVCHSPAVPCSTGDLEVGNNAGQWPVDTSSIPFAKWIWLPGITGQTPAANVNAWFEKVINVPGTPTGGSVQVAVDDGAEIYVNGTSIGRAGILDGDPIGFDSLVTRSIPPGILVEGNNVITVRGLNGTTPGDYNTNPAAVIFSGTINFVYGSTTTTTTTVAANTTTTVTVVPVGAFTASIVRGPNSAAGSAVYTVTLRATGVVTGGVYEFVVPSGHVPEPVPPDRITHRFPKSAVNGEVVWEYSLLAPRGVFRAEVYSVGGTTPFSSVEVK